MFYVKIIFVSKRYYVLQYLNVCYNFCRNLGNLFLYK
jgi:hypothetical protein